MEIKKDNGRINFADWDIPIKQAFINEFEEMFDDVMSRYIKKAMRAIDKTNVRAFLEIKYDNKINVLKDTEIRVVLPVGPTESEDPEFVVNFENLVKEYLDMHYFRPGIDDYEINSMKALAANLSNLAKYIEIYLDECTKIYAEKVVP